MAKDKNGIKFIEILTHFCCAYCKKWWSIGDCDKDKLEWFCPRCGKKQRFKLAEAEKDKACSK